MIPRQQENLAVGALATYLRCPDLEELWRESQGRGGGERKLTCKYAAFQVLVLDERLLDRPDGLFTASCWS